MTEGDGEDGAARGGEADGVGGSLETRAVLIGCREDQLDVKQSLT